VPHPASLQKAAEWVPPPQGPCSIAYVANSGFANQLLGLMNAVFVAQAAGCGLWLAPVLEHMDLAYEWPNDPAGGLKADTCLKGTKHEYELIRNASKLYYNRTLQIDQMLELKPNSRILGRFTSLHRDLDSLKKIPLNCSVWVNMTGGQPRLMSSFLQSVVKEGEPDEVWAMGSGYRVFYKVAFQGMWRVGFRNIFQNFAAPVRRVADILSTALTQGTGTKRYACIHLRSLDPGNDINLTVNQTMALASWIWRVNKGGNFEPMHLLKRGAMRLNQLSEPSEADDRSAFMRQVCNDVDCVDGNGRAVFPEDGPTEPNQVTLAQISNTSQPVLPSAPQPMPLYVMSTFKRRALNAILSPACAGRRCWTLKDFLKHVPIDLGFPEGQKDNEELILDMAVCSRANAVYLPNNVGTPQVLVDGQVRPLTATKGLFQSTLSTILGQMASFGQYHP